MGGEIVVSCTVVTCSPEQAVRAAEAFARAAIGLVLEGVPVSLSMSMPDDEGDEA